MNTAIQTIVPTINSAEIMSERGGDSPLSPFASERQMRRAIDQPARLQSEVNELRVALAQAMRLLAHQELLLRNARQREFELLAILVGESF